METEAIDIYNNSPHKESLKEKNFRSSIERSNYLVLLIKYKYIVLISDLPWSGPRLRKQINRNKYLVLLFNLHLCPPTSLRECLNYGSIPNS